MGLTKQSGRPRADLMTHSAWRIPTMGHALLPSLAAEPSLSGYATLC